MNKHRSFLNNILIITIILLFIFTSINPSSAFDNVKKSSIPISDGNILYVGGNGTGNYTKIQDAIDNATDGDTVFVYDDSSPYDDVSLNINKSIKLQGENMTTTIIHGWCYINSNYVIITGFMFEDYGPAMVIDGFSNSIVENCIFNKSLGGIYIEKSNNNIIRNCSFNFCEFRSLNIDSSNDNEISYCDFFDSYDWMIGGAAIEVGFSCGTSIHHCNITRNYAGGVSVAASFVQLSSNNIFNNDGPGVEIGFLSSFDLRNNWWGSSQGPNITLNGRFARKFIIRQVDYGDTVFFWGKPFIMELMGIIRLLPWLIEPVADAGQQFN